ncbi:unnamed protein product [Trichogramma brassicae]|uniref:Protein kinase domain-containing protein n=1 Tax=Trichogramma brassicae TaxID=86971 RepID=A0A6H5IWE3_9HYME|nr:unnamed protein product [Trichogramma brassicae]
MARSPSPMQINARINMDSKEKDEYLTQSSFDRVALDGDNYNKIEIIGSGTYGEVYKAVRVKYGSLVAMKKIFTEDEKSFPISALREIKLVRLMEHENIVKFIEVARSQALNDGRFPSYYMVFEFCDHDLAGLLSNEEINFEPAEIKMIIKMLCDALHYIHANHVAHRDLKPANILMTREGVLKLADFGLARTISARREPQRYTNVVVTLWYRAPELLLGEQYYSGNKVDMWAVGCIMAELWTRSPLLQTDTETQQLNLVTFLCGSVDEADWPEVKNLPLYETIELRKGLERKVLPKLRKFVEDRSCLDLIDRLLVLNPKKRLDADQVYEHDYFFTEPWPRELKNLMQSITTSNFEKTNAYQQQQRQQEANSGNHGSYEDRIY